MDLEVINESNMHVPEEVKRLTIDQVARIVTQIAKVRALHAKQNALYTELIHALLLPHSIGRGKYYRGLKPKPGTCAACAKPFKAATFVYQICDHGGAVLYEIHGEPHCG